MDYIKIYNAIIDNAKNSNRIKLKKNDTDYIYFENHHIIPKCMGGTDDIENLVLLTAREHYVCHKLLTFIYNNRGITLAFIRMIHSKNFKHTFSSRDYEYAKQQLIKQMTGSTLSDSHRQNIGASLKGKKSPKSLIARENMSKSRLKYLSENENPLKGKKRPEFAKNQLGEKNPMYGKHLSTDTKNKLRKALLGKSHNLQEVVCSYCGKVGKGPNMSRWHNDNCKFKPL